MIQGMGNGVVRAGALVVVMLACTAGCGDNAVATRDRGSAGSSAGMVVDTTPPQAGRGNLGGGGGRGAGVSAGGGGTSSADAPPPSPIPQPRYREECDLEFVKEGCNLVLLGELDGREISYGYATFANDVYRTPSYDVSGISVVGNFGADGHVDVSSVYSGRDYDPTSASPVEKLALSGGLLRLPRGVLAEPGVWWCLDHGSIEWLDRWHAVVEVDALSRLTSRAEVEGGDDWIQGTVNKGYQTTAVPASFLHQSTAHLGWRGGGITSWGTGTLYYAVGAGSESWHLRAWGEDFWSYLLQDIVFIDASSPRKWAMAFAGPASSIAMDVAATDSGPGDHDTAFDLSQISSPVQCPGTPVTGKLTIHTNWER